MLRWAILGTGFISNTVISAIAESEGSAVAVIAGRDRDRVAAMQSEHNIPAGVVGFDEVLADPDIDAVYIGLPNHKHHEPAVAAARAGKAVLSEKSLTTTMASAQELIDGVQEANTFFVEGLMYLAHPMYATVTEVLTDGRLGQIRSISGRYAANIASVVNPHGKGTLYNLGCYPVSLLHLVMQTAFGADAFSDRTISAVGNLVDVDGAEANVCDAALAVRFGNGVLATLQSTDNFGNASEFGVAGDNGVLRFATNPWLPVAGENVLTWNEFGSDNPERIVIADDHDAFYHQIKLVESCVAEGRTEAPRPSPRHNDSLEIMGMLTDWEAAVSEPKPFRRRL